MRPDDESPEWSKAEIQGARPALDVISDVFGPDAAQRLKRGRPPNPNRKINQTLRLDPDVVEAYRQIGTGWQARINQILRDNMPKHQG